MGHNDFDLARRVMAGDESAFEEFFAEHFLRLYRYARARLAGDDDAAEDVAQTTLIKAIDKLHTYRGEAALFTWMCTFCRREIAEKRARAGKAAEMPLIDDHPETRAALDALAVLANETPETALARQELARLVHATLEHLPRRYGDVLEWKYIHGLPVDEIASRLGVGYKAAESVLTRAREAFREGFSLVIDSVPQPSALGSKR
jgi:RNA polymerase sigma-70 factor (ECF subfamily)